MGISLEKRSQSVKIKLEKRNIREKITVRVGAVLDKSGSAEPFYVRGEMQELVDRLLAVAHQFDDNGEIDMWAFHNQSIPLETATAASYGGYVNQYIMKGAIGRSWGGTEYAPPIKDVTEFYFPTSQPKEEKKGLFGKLFGGSETKAVVNPAADIPALVMFVTDGENSDKAKTERLLAESVDKPIYWLFIGIGHPSSFSFIEEMGEKYPHVGFVSFSDLNISDDDMYDEILSKELADFVLKHKK